MERQFVKFARIALVLTLFATVLSSEPMPRWDVSIPSQEREIRAQLDDKMPVSGIGNVQSSTSELVGFKRAMNIAEAPPPVLQDQFVWSAAFFGAVVKVATKALPVAKKAATFVGRSLAQGFTAAKNTSVVRKVGGGLATGAAFEVGKRAVSHAFGDRH